LVPIRIPIAHLFTFDYDLQLCFVMRTRNAIVLRT